MRKILLMVVIVLLVALGITTVTKGMQIGSLKINSVKEIGENSEKLDAKVQEINTLIDSQYPSKRNELTKASKEEQSQKEEYLDEINLSSNEELEEILEIKNFDIERIWAVVGNHAIDQGVNITLSETKSSSTGARNLHFIVKGTYVAQTNFLYAIEDDPELNYRIYNYKLVPSDDAQEKELNIIKATFAIKETMITKSLNDSLNGYEKEDQRITDSIFDYPSMAINGKKEPYDNMKSPAEIGEGSPEEIKPTPTPTPEPSPTPGATPTPTPSPTPTPGQ